VTVPEVDNKVLVTIRFPPTLSVPSTRKLAVEDTLTSLLTTKVPPEATLNTPAVPPCAKTAPVEVTVTLELTEITPVYAESIYIPCVVVETSKSMFVVDEAP